MLEYGADRGEGNSLPAKDAEAVAGVGGGYYRDGWEIVRILRATGVDLRSTAKPAGSCTIDGAVFSGRSSFSGWARMARGFGS